MEAERRHFAEKTTWHMIEQQFFVKRHTLNKDNENTVISISILHKEKLYFQNKLVQNFPIRTKQFL